MCAMNSDSAPQKAKELLPDVLEHQGRMYEKRQQLSSIITQFENNWAKKQPSSELKEASDKEEMAAVQQIYRNMDNLETDFDTLINRLRSMREQYLGDK